MALPFVSYTLLVIFPIFVKWSHDAEDGGNEEKDEGEWRRDGGEYGRKD